MAKIDIISGFLGAGKTTLIKKLISESFKDEQVVLIENEFGEIGIDGGFLKQAGVNITEMNSGCICCSLVGDFGEALKQVVTDYKPDRVIIEPSGVGKLSDVIKAIEKASADVDINLNSATTVVDVSKARMYIKNFGEFFLNQIEACGTVVLSRTQTASEEKIKEAVSLIREHNADVKIITTPWDDITGDIILDAIEHSSKIEDIMKNFRYDPEVDDEDEHDHEHHHHHHEHEDHDHHHEEHEHHHDHDHEEHEHHHDHDHDDHDHDHHHEHEEHDHHHHHHHGHHHADDIFDSWGRETENRYDRAELDEVLSKLAKEDDTTYGIILRAKGIVPDKEGKWLEFDLVPGEYEIREGAADYTGKLCVIGSELKEDEISRLFTLN